MIRGRDIPYGDSWDGDFSDREFQRLVGELLEGQISEPDFARLQKELEQSESLRDS